MPLWHNVFYDMDEKELNLITERIIGCCIEVHRELGPGLLESIYEKALIAEFNLNSIQFTNQVVVPVIYKDQNIGEYRLDFLIEDEIVLELKAVDRIESIFEAQLLTYLKVTKKKLGLLINFNNVLLKNGIKRIIL